MALSHRIDRQGSETVLHLTGDFTFSENKAFRGMIQDLEQGASSTVVVELSKVDNLDSAALSMLMLLKEKLTGRTLILRRPPEKISRVLEVVAFDKIFKIET